MPNLSGIQQYDDPSDPYGAQRTKIARKLALSQALQSQGMESLPSDRQVGGWAIKTSPFEGLAKLAQTYAGVKTGQKAEKERGELAKQSQTDYQAALVKALSQMETDPTGAMGTLAKHPRGAELMPIVAAEYQRQRQMKALEGWLARQGSGMPPQGPQAPQPGQGQGYGVVAPGATTGATPPTQGMPVGAQNVLGGAMLGIPGLSDLGKMQHSDAQTRGGVQFDQNGQAYIISNSGQRVDIPNTTARDKNEMVDTGGGIQPTNPYTGAPGGAMIPKTPSFSDQAAQQRNVMEGQRLQWETGMQPGGQPAPAQPQVRGVSPQPNVSPVPIAQNAPRSSYSTPLGPIPGGAPMTPKAKAELSAERAKTAPQAKLSLESNRGQHQLITGKVDEAMKLVSGLTTGLPGSALVMVPGSPAYDLGQLIDTIKANLGFKELAQMRQASPTGGALGQVTVREIEFLQAAVASLQQGQSQSQLKKHLGEIKTHYDNWLKLMERNYSDTYGGVVQEAPAGNAPLSPQEQKELQDLRRRFNR